MTKASFWEGLRQTVWSQRVLRGHLCQRDASACRLCDGPPFPTGRGLAWGGQPGQSAPVPAGPQRPQHLHGGPREGGQSGFFPLPPRRGVQAWKPHGSRVTALSGQTFRSQLSPPLITTAQTTAAAHVRLRHPMCRELCELQDTGLLTRPSGPPMREARVSKSQRRNPKAWAGRGSRTCVRRPTEPISLATLLLTH